MKNKKIDEQKAKEILDKIENGELSIPQEYSKIIYQSVEKQIKKATKDTHSYPGYRDTRCPRCGALQSGWKYCSDLGRACEIQGNGNYCQNCGQRC